MIVVLGISVLSWNQASAKERANRRLIREAEVRERNQGQRLHLALDASGAGVWESDTVADRNDWDARTEQLHGFRCGAFDGSSKAWAECVHPDDLRATVDALDRSLQTGVPYYAQYRVRRAEGGWRHLAARGAFVQEGAGKPVRLVGVVQDITARAALERRFREAVLAAPIAMVLSDDDGTIVLLNQEAKSMLGYSGDELQGQKVEVLVPETLRAQHTHQLILIIHHRQPAHPVAQNQTRRITERRVRRHRDDHRRHNIPHLKHRASPSTD
jgi:PAS domain S-box-containing protein